MAWQQYGAGPGRAHYRADIQADHESFSEAWTWQPGAADAIARAQWLLHPAGLRVFALRGPAGYYDAWQRVVPGRDHQPPVYGALLDGETGAQLAASGYTSSLSATYEGGWAALWQHTLAPTSTTWANYVIGYFLDGGDASVTVAGTLGRSLALGLPQRYAEQVGDVALSLNLTVTPGSPGVACFLGFRAWHGGTRPIVYCTDLRRLRRWVLWQGRAWTTATTHETEDGLEDGSGLAIAEASRSVVATLNRRQPADREWNGLYSWPISGTGTSCQVLGGTWGAPAVAPDGATVCAIRDGIWLVCLDTRVCEAREAPIVSHADLSRWSQPPVMTDDVVIVVESPFPEVEGDLQAYRLADLEPAWRSPAGIGWHVDPLSGWRRSLAAWAQADRRALYVAGRGGIFALDHRTGEELGWVAEPDETIAPDGWYAPQLAVRGGSTYLLALQMVRRRGFALCQEHLCPDGKPVNSVDMARCCVGTTSRCEHVDCALCESLIGWCPHEQERRRLVYPGTLARVWRGTAR